MTLQPFARAAAVGISREAEDLWGRLWSQLALRDGFWLGYVFTSSLTEVAELEARSRDYLLMQTKRVQHRALDHPDDYCTALSWLLSRHPGDLGLTWLVGLTDLPDRGDLWRTVFRRLNERRDQLRTSHPAGLIIVCPPALLPFARDEAPDLWSYRVLTAELHGARPATSHPPEMWKPSTGALENSALSEPDTGAAVEPSDRLEPILRRVAVALQADMAADAVAAALDAVAAAEGSGSTDDLALARAWLARAMERSGDLVAAVRHARGGLELRRPLGRALTEALLKIVARSPDATVGLEAWTGLLVLARANLREFPDSPEALRDLAVALAWVGDIHQARGQLDDALHCFTEALDLSRRIRDHYGDTPDALRDLAVALRRVGGIHQTRGQLDDALRHHTEALDLHQRLDDVCGPPHADHDELATVRAAAARTAEAIAERDAGTPDGERRDQR
ncbi:MAG: tetratricopeptide repeat protein [Pseudonocardiaceae bacterium]